MICLPAGGDASILTTSTSWRPDRIVPFTGGSRLERPRGPIRSCAGAVDFAAGGKDKLVVLPRRSLPPGPYAVRKPKEYRALQPDDFVQVDTLDVRPLPAVIWKRFTARNV